MATTLPLPSSFSSFLQHEEEEEGDSNVAAVAFFRELRCNAAPQLEEEGDSNCRRLLHGAALQRSSTTRRRRRQQQHCHRLLLLFFSQHKVQTLLCGATLQRNKSCATQLHKQTNKLTKECKK
jgi:hypothetical protein